RSHKRELAAIHDMLARVHVRDRRFARARESAREAVRLLREVAASVPGEPRFQRDLVTALLTLALAESKGGRFAPARTATQECVKLLRGLEARGLLKDLPEDRKLLQECEEAVKEMGRKLGSR